LKKAASTHPSTPSQTVEAEIATEEMIMKAEVATEEMIMKAEIVIEEITKAEVETGKATAIEKTQILILLQFL
jgi:hypothetical protein